MGTWIVVNFYGLSRFSGQTADRKLEWPPSPARLFSALVSGAAIENDPRVWNAIEDLEMQPAPTIYFSEASNRVGFTTAPRSKRLDPLHSSASESKQEKQFREIVGRFPLPNYSTTSNGGRLEHRSGAKIPFLPKVVYELGAELDNEIVELLDRAASNVSFLGRSTDHATVQIGNEDPPADLEKWVPGFGPLELRVWGQGYLSALRTRFARDDRSKHGKLPLPAHHKTDVTSTLVSYRRANSLQIPQALDFRFGAKMPSQKLGKVAEILAGVAIPYISEYDRKVAGCVAQLDHPLEKNSLIEKIKKNLKLDVEKVRDDTVQTRAIFGSHTAWRSLMPIHGVPDSTVMRARIISDAYQKFDTVPVSVDLTPADQITQNERTSIFGPRRSPGMALWHTRVVMPFDIPGPVRVGWDQDRGAGILVSDEN
ncbi:type I-U CRISPR-associated protein Csb2 [Corynebacterium glucuronolyticum]|uniref:type I-G CRISPR-associated protein Csb2 n=1 Tax=Corynebacterium glucuronolyticum TaxID=39791 RepID=UPI001F264142|nr:type I-U CRISPR-associated protein Csb2 [Corynebacterium glucuronolyticum]